MVLYIYISTNFILLFWLVHWLVERSEINKDTRTN